MMLSMFVNDRWDNWNELLPFVMHAYRTSVHESTGYSQFRLMMDEECSLPQDVSTAELRTKRENDVAPQPFATWVRDAFEVAYDHVRSSLSGGVVGITILPTGRSTQIGFPLDRTSSSRSTGHRSHGWHSA